MENIENILWKGKTLAYIIRTEIKLEKTTFPFPPELNMQVGFVVYPKGGRVISHVHLPLKRAIVGTSEVLIIRKGHCEVDIYNDARELVATRKLRQGDILILVSGGHGLRMIEDTIFVEVKQGPYTGLKEKELF